MFLVNKKSPGRNLGKRVLKKDLLMLISDNRATGDINLELPRSIF